ncbi:cytochrome c [bacterium]|nr:cytochrome c [bacterium]MBU1991104.1 cytochrome c [bacterium]
MKTMLILMLPLLLFSKSSFITPAEYASQLYKNPRGIGCQNCHGEHGEGRIVARYMHKKEKMIFEGPAINTLEFKEFYKALNERKSAMPRYFLTDKEIKALYFYLHKDDKKKDEKKKPNKDVKK